MNNLLRKATKLLLGISMAAGVGVAIGSKAAKRADADSTFTIEFKDNNTNSDGNSDQGAAPDVSSIVKASSAEYVDSFSNCSKLYLGKTGYGIKIGASGNPGTVNFTLATAYQNNIKSIKVVSAQYGTDTGTLTLYNGSTSLHSGITPGTDYTYTFENASSVSSVKLTTSAKRAYILSLEFSVEGSGGGPSADQIVFKDNGSDSGTVFTATTALEYVKTGASLIDSFSNITRAYPGTTGVKFGSSSNSGNFTINLKSGLSLNGSTLYATISKYGTDSGTLNFSSNGFSGTISKAPTSTSTEYEIATFSSEPTTITVATSAKRGYLQSLRFRANNTDEPSVNFDITESVVGKGLSTTITATGENLGSSSIGYSSSNTSIATVNATTGEVTGVAFGSAVITATATVSGDDYTDEYTIYVTSSLTYPYSIAQAKTAIDSGHGLDNQYVKGVVYQVDNFNSTYNQITYWISDNGSNSVPFEVYGGLGISGAGFSDVTDINVGDIVVVKGQLKKSGSTYEFNYGNELISQISVLSIIVKTAPTKTTYDEGECFAPAGLVVTATYNDNPATTMDFAYADLGSLFTFSPTTSTALTNQNSVTITLFGKTTSQVISVTARSITGVTVTGSMNNTTYVKDASWNLEGLSLTVTYSTGNPSVLPLNTLTAGTDFTLSKSTADGTTSLTISGTYQGSSITSRTISGITYVSEVTFTSGTDVGESAGQNNDTIYKYGVTLNCTSFYSASGVYRFYKDSTVTLASSGENIRKVEFTDGGDASNPITNLVLATGQSGSYSDLTWLGDSQSVSFTASAQARASSVKVTTESGYEEVLDPTTLSMDTATLILEEGEDSTALTFTTDSPSATFGWYSEDSSKATVANGVVHAIGNSGTVKIYVYFDTNGNGSFDLNTDLSAYCTVTLTPVTIDYSTVSYGGVGTLVTTLGGISQGDKIAITNVDDDALAGTSIVSSTIRLSTASFSISNSQLIIGDGTEEIDALILTVDTYNSSTGAMTLKSGTKWLSSTAAKKTSFADSAFTWTLSFDGTTPILTSSVANGGTMQYNYNNGTDPRFAPYASTQSEIHIWNVAEYTDEAIGYATSFIKGDGSSNTCSSTISNWSTHKSNFESLTTGAKNILKNATHNASELYTTSNEYSIQHCVARYDDAVRKHVELQSAANEFMGRFGVGTVNGELVNPSISLISLDNSNTIAIIVIISMVSVTAIGGYFFIKRRKVN